MPQVGEASEHLQDYDAGWMRLDPATLRQLAPEAIIVIGCETELEIPPALAEVITDIKAVIATSGPGRRVRLRTDGYVFSRANTHTFPVLTGFRPFRFRRRSGCR